MNIKTFSIHALRNVFAFFIALGLGYVAYTVSPSSVEIPKAEAAPTSLSGYAWSDTIGYISFSGVATDGSPYSVKIDPDNGNFSGHAWSSDIDTAPNPDQGGIGWISFDRSKTGNPPSAPFNGGSGPIAQTDSSGNVTGWARALAGCDNIPADPETTPCVTAGSGSGNASGGWDGWIKLSGTWTNSVKINPSDGKFSGYAWGGAKVLPSGDSDPTGVSVIGWIKFAANGNVPAGSDDATCSGVTNDYSGTTKCTYGVKGPTLTSDCNITPGICSGATPYCQVSSGTCIAANGSCPLGNNDCVVGQQCNGSTQCVDTDGTCLTSANCAGVQVCNASGRCVAPTGGYCDTSADCFNSQICNTTTHACYDKPKTKFWQF